MLTTALLIRQFDGGNTGEKNNKNISFHCKPFSFPSLQIKQSEREMTFYNCQINWMNKRETMSDRKILYRISSPKP